MMGSFFTRAMLMIFGYVYPAYECYKIVEVNAPEMEHLRLWCQYWILVALLTAFERIADAFVSWLPMYSEAKLAFYVYLWYPKMQGTIYIYGNFLRPFIAKHETEIDRYLLEFRTRVGNVMVKFWEKAASYAHKIFFEVLLYVVSQSQEPPIPSVQPFGDDILLFYSPFASEERQLQQQPKAHQTSSASPPLPQHSRRIRAQKTASSSETAAHQSPAAEEATQAVTINGEETKSPSQTHGWFRRLASAIGPGSLGGRIGDLRYKSISLD